MKKQIESKLGKQLDQARKYGGSGRNMVWKSPSKSMFEEMEMVAMAKFAKLAALEEVGISPSKRAKML